MNITLKNLEAVVNRINKAVGNTEHNAIGNYQLDNAYGGWMLVKIMNDGGGINTITQGYRSKRELYDQLFAFIAGVEAAQNELKQQINQLTKGE